MMEFSTDGSPEGRSELDSHADTTAAGSNMVMLDDIRNVTNFVSVSPFSATYEPIHNVPIATCATAWENPEDGSVTIIVFHEALYFGDTLKNSLICPNQVRDCNSNVVHDTPRQFSSDSLHGMLLRDDEYEVFIPFHLHGVISYMDTRKPTDYELRTCPHIAATSDRPWTPYSSRFAEDELALSHSLPNRAQDTLQSLRLQHLHRVLSSLSLTECSLAHDNNLISRVLEVFPESIAGDGSEGDNRSVSSLQPLDERSHKRRVHWGPNVVNPEKRQRVDAAELSRRWNISLKRAQATVRVTTQKGIRNVQHPITKRMKTQPYRNKRILPGKWYTDAIHFKYPSITRGDKVCQLFTNGRGYDEVYPVKSTSQSHEGLMQLIGDIGVPEILVSDNANTQGALGTYNTQWNKLISRYHIRQQFIQPHCPWQNLAEHSAAYLRSSIRRMTSQKASPKRLWSYCAKLAVGRRQRVSSSDSSMMGRTPFECVKGYTPDITLYLVHDWYDFIWWYDCNDKEEKLGRWLGPCGDQYGGGDCHFILSMAVKVRVTNSTRPLTETEWKNPDLLRRMDEINQVINNKIGDGLSNNEAIEADDYPDPPDDLFDGHYQNDDVILRASPEDSAPDVDDLQTENTGYDKYIGTEVLMQMGDERMRGIVKNRCRDANGALVGVGNRNPFLDTRSYEVQLADGSTEIYTANTIAENIYAAIDDEGRSFVLMDEIIDHESDDTALGPEEAVVTSKSGQKSFKPTTRGWRLLVNWRDGGSSWVKLSDMKESFPIETAEYAVSNKIDSEPAFRWWVKRVLRKKNRIISAAKSKYWLRTHKYGVRLPKTIKEALAIDAETNTTHWRDAISKEMKNSSVAFEFKEDDKIPVGHTKITMHMVFDVKIDLTRKARLCGDGHKVPATARESTYSSVPSRDSIRIFFMLAALNDLDVLSADIQNAYLTAPISEKYYTVANQEQGFSQEFWGRPCKIVRALYGLPVAGASFRAHLVKNLRELGYTSCKADPDVHMRPAFKPNGEEYWEYCIAYVDDILVMGHDVKLQMDSIERRFKLKNGTIEEPSFYLGADILRTYIDGKGYWSMSSMKYTAKAVSAVEEELNTGRYGYKYLPTTVKTPLASGYRPEIDSSPELTSETQNYYQGLIGILRWICKLGRLDIIMPVSLLSRYLAQAREGHLHQVFHIFAYLKKYGRSKLVFDSTIPVVDESSFQDCDWSEYYPGAKEPIPPDAPEPRGKSVLISCFVDADHAGCKATRRSHTGVITFVNRAPILWYSKRQTTVETSTFGSEIVAMRIAVELVEGLRYKLRMMGVRIDGPANMYCDNDSVVKNTTRPESVCKKKHNSIAYHKIRETIAAGSIRVAKEPGETNVADLLTKLMGGAKFADLCTRCMYRTGDREK